MTDDHERVDPPQRDGERATLTGWLDWHRATFLARLAGLPDGDLRSRPVTSSGLSLLGLLRHLADVERHWFRRVLAGEDAPPRFYSEDNVDGDFNDVDSTTVADVRAAWSEEVRAARAITGSYGLEASGTPEGPTLRWILVHMIEEYARHNGHADLIRESIDGLVGF